MKLKNVAFILGLIFFGSIKAQVEKQIRPAQISLITPLGTNGLNSHQFINHVSLNAIAGVSGGVDGVELGGFANVVHGDVKGIQLAGFANVNTGSTEGVQGGGFANVSGKVTGAQLAGFANYSNDSVQGAQFAGFVNVSQSLNGGQFAGFANVVYGDVTGAQLSGFINFAKKVDGVQLGFINVADSVNGATIGFISIVKKGLRELEVGSNETFQTNLTFKTGTSRFYNLFTGAARWTPDKVYWVAGYGVGTQHAFTPNWKVNADAISYFLIRESGTNEDWSSINKLQISCSYKFNSGLTVFAGPTFNVISGNNASEDFEIAPWETYREEYTRTTIIMYPGFNFGLRI